MRLTFVAYGRPIPQGSVRSLGAGRPSIHGNAQTLLPWRDTINGAARTAAALDGWTRVDSPVSVLAVFYFDRPRSHYRTGKNAHLLRDGVPAFPGTRAQGDIEKLVRGLNDALVAAGVVVDDSQVASLAAYKRWTCPAYPQPCAVVAVRPLLEAPDFPTSQLTEQDIA